MHHQIFPSQDTYLTDRPNNLDVLNFGVDEILQAGTQNKFTGFISPTKDYTYINATFDGVGVSYFNGTFTGSVHGPTGSSYAVLSGNGIILSSSYFSGNITSGSFNGLFTGSFDVGGFTGSIASGSQICFLGTASGVDTREARSRQYMTQSYADHALIQFDITAISKSIASGGIVSASSVSFHLKVKICNEVELPEEYTIYAAPISESWVGGDGYMSDGGSDKGASWVYRDYNGGTPWSASGGTMATPYCSQSFKYKSADLNMDVTPIVNLWLTGSPNYGFIIFSSDELHPTGSGFLLKYFSNETNTIYSPVLDVGWDDWKFVTGSFNTSSFQIVQISGSNLAVNNSGSWFDGIGGVHGNFTASSDLNFGSHYIMSSGDMTYYCDHFVQQFTGSLTGSFFGWAQVSAGTFSGSGTFYADYFSGSIGGVDQVISGFSEYNETGETYNINGTYISGTIRGNVFMPTDLIEVFEGNLMSDSILLTGTGSGRYYDTASNSFDGFIWGTGISGNIRNVPIFGPAFGVISATTTVVTLPTEWVYSYATSPNEAPYGNIIRQLFNCPSCGTTPCGDPRDPNYKFCNPNPYAFDSLYYIWGGDDVGWRMPFPAASSSVITSSCGKFHTVQIMTGTFNGGVFSGSSFLAFYENYKISFATLTGSWNPSAISGESIIINFPSLYDSYYSAYLYGQYVYGPLLGVYTPSGSYTPYSASFYGQFTDGMFAGGTVGLQLSGSVSTSSYTYPVSGTLSSSSLYPLDIEKQFSINLTNLQSEYKAGDIIKLNVFGRKKYPQKFFDLTNQQSQYLIPEFLPTASYYALKDNQTDEIVINFDYATQISCEYPDGNYFLIDTTGLPQERYYRVLIRVKDGTISNTIDTGKIFKIVR